MDFVNAQGAGELLERPLAIGRAVELLDLPTQAVVDEAGGQLQEEVAAQGPQQTFDVEAIFKEAVQNRFADGVAILGLGFDAVDLGAEGGATATGGPVLAGGHMQQEDGAVGDAPDGTRERVLAVAGGATTRTRGVLGSIATVAVPELGLCGKHACLSW